ncbi:EcsC family protein [Paracraurococcus lichenis]|uniref:EcsC family protein n=1 Tax=Paracraurococcus lichenis TaxID=3064888 RepID=A0ABT9E447_9PROT|nr:EcsC family protein [Paracraurococcus sp. LOR1-02]MDO9710855.1 EcsC family protein [Paracraurococcus sp. LOR1-02]
MSDTDRSLPTPALPAEALAELDAAVVVLEGTSLPVRLAALVGGSVEALKRRLPEVAQRGLDGAVRRALGAAMQAALRSGPDRRPGRLPKEWLHRGLLAASGAAGGALGLVGTLAELPVSTTLLLRQVAAIAAEQGEDLTDPQVQAECLKVFALGGRSPSDDEAESGYFALRLALAEAVQTAVGRGVAQFLPGFLGAIAARFGAPVALKLSAQAAPVVGAAGGAAINLAFLEHFRAIARAHFTVRRLERRHGPALVRAAYERLRQHPVAA